MRRKEFAVETQAEIDEFLTEMTFGFLAIASAEDEWPHVVPINYVYTNGNIYVHGSKIGQKMDSLRSNAKVSFTVAKEYAIIPSYFTDPTFACPATAYFKSVQLKGYAEVLTDLTEKATALTAFMRKLQPEGGYEPIDANNTEYIPRVEGVAVIKIIPEHVSAKFKFGQTNNEKKTTAVANGLRERNFDSDMKTVEMMKKYCPHYSDHSK